MATDKTILKIPNYYWGTRIDPQTYYIDRQGQSTRATEFKDIYLSDLVDKADCVVSFSAYRNVDNISEKPKITSTKWGVVKTYNPVTGLVAVDSMKENPSLPSHLLDNTRKIRYVDPAVMTVASISAKCRINPIVGSSSESLPLTLDAEAKAAAAAQAAASSSGGSYNPNYKKTLKRFRKLRKNRKSTRNKKRLRKHVRKNKRTLRYKKA